MKGMSTVRDVFSEFIKDEAELTEFAEWAFGSYFRELDQAMNFLETWNYLHSDILKLEPDGLIVQDAEKMVAAWRAK